MPELREDDYQFLSVEKATDPPGGMHFQHYVDHWWALHPEKGLAFYNPKNDRTGRRRQPGLGAPQCNASEQVARLVADKAVPWTPEVRQLKSVWVPIRIEDYR